MLDWKIVSGVVAQALAAISNLAAVGVGAAVLSPSKLGELSFFLALYAVLLAAVRGAIVALLASVDQRVSFRRISRVLIASAAVISLSGGLAFGTRSAFTTAVVFVVLLPGLVRHESARATLLHDGEPARVVLLDAGWLIVAAVGATIALWQSLPGAAILAGWGVGSYVSFIPALRTESQARLGADTQQRESLLRSMADYIIGGVAPFIANVVLAVAGGSALLGAVRAAQLPTSVPRIAQAPTAMVAIGRIRRLYPIAPSMRDWFSIASVPLLVNLLSIAAFVALPSRFWVDLFGENGDFIVDAGLQFLLVNLVLAASIAPTAVLRASGMVNKVLAMRVTSVALLAVLLALLADDHGVHAAVVAWGASNTLLLVLSIAGSVRTLRRRTVGAV